MALDVGTLVAYLTLDDSRFVEGVREAEQQGRKAGARVETSFADASRSADKLGRSASDAGRDVGKLGRGASDVDKVGQSAKRSADDVGRISQAAQGASQKLTGLAGQVSERAGAGGGGAFVSGFASKLGDLGGKGGPIAASLVGVTAVGLMAGAVLMKAINDGMQREVQLDLTQAKLGVDEATMRRIGDAAGRAYSNAFGESFEANLDTARAAAKAGLLDTDASAAEMQTVIEQLDGVAKVMEIDIPQAAKTAGLMVKTGLAKNGTEAFDLLTFGAQRVETEVGDIADVFGQKSATLTQFGLTGQEAMGMFAQAIDAGAPSADYLVGALEELAGNAGDSADTFAELGLNGDEMAERLTGGGKRAAEGLDMLLDKLRDPELSPKARSIAFTQLFGEEATAMQEALMAVDVSSATADLDNFAGTAKRAVDAMGDNPANQMEKARRSIETSADAIEMALGQAFGPALGDVAEWVGANKPEIIGFFTGLADAGFATLDAVLGFSSGALRAWAFFAEGVGSSVGQIVHFLAGLVEAQANVLDLIPGMGGQADDFHGIADSMQSFANGAQTAGDKARGLADVIDAGRPKLQGMRDDVRAAGEAAQNSEVMMRALGDGVTVIPGEKDITITDNSPEAIQRLEALGFKVETTPSGIKVTANTGPAEEIMTDYLNRERAMTVWVDIKKRRDAAGVPSDFVGPAIQDVAPNADGNIHESGPASIRQGQGRGIYQWAEAETGWEAFIPGAASKRPRAERILQEVADRFGFGLVKMADGGINGDAAVAFAKSKDNLPYSYGGAGGDNWDCSGYMSGIFNKLTGGSTRFTTDSDFASMGWAPGYDPDGFSIGTNGGSGENGHMAGTLFGTNVESGSANGVQYGGPALGAQDFPMVWHWPGASGGDNPSTEELAQADRMVEDALAAELNASGPSKADATKRRQMLEQQRDKLKGGAAGTTDSGVSLSTDGQRVFVTNWPSGASTELTASKPAPAPSGGGGGRSAAPAPATSFTAPPTPQQRLSDWAQQAGPDLAESWGIPKPGGVLGALLSPETGQAAAQTLAGITAQLQQLIDNPPVQEVYNVTDIDEALRKRDANRAAKTLTWTR
ncbi:hypothetical protein ABIC28_002039 [Rhodococcus sp. PvR044]|uniref:phage tail tape measure protein n=1 Tax=Rhodococcus sp. PvR044 TaxID=3156402 RepID=UPI00339B9812